MFASAIYAIMRPTAFLLVFLAPVASAQRSLASLAARWNLTEPTYAFDSNQFTLDFPVTDFIVDGQARYTLWTSPDCQSDNGKLLQTSSFFTHSVTGNADLLAGASLDSGAFTGRSAQVNVTINPYSISSQDAVTDGVYSEEVVNNQQIATIKVCVRFGLWTTTSMGVNTPIEVNFLESMLTLFVDLTDGFQIGDIEIEAKDRLIRTENQAYGVDGYECSATSTTPLTASERARPRNPGEVFHVCVTPEATAIRDGILMRSIDNFGFTRQVEFLNDIECGSTGCSVFPTQTPSRAPSDIPTISHAPSVSHAPTESHQPTPAPSVSHEPTLSIRPSSKPSSMPSSKPSSRPSVSHGPSPAPSPGPSQEPSPAPSPQPSPSSMARRALQTRTINQAAIEDGRPAGNMLTSFDFAACKGALVCRFSSILFAQFFFTDTPGRVNGEGVASLQYGGGRRTRQLRTTEGGASRDLQEEEEGAGTAIFELEIEVNQAQARAGSGARSLSMVVTAAIAALVAMTLL
jgi:hypothetical protein